MPTPLKTRTFHLKCSYFLTLLHISLSCRVVVRSGLWVTINNFSGLLKYTNPYPLLNLDTHVRIFWLLLKCLLLSLKSFSSFDHIVFDTICHGASLLKSAMDPPPTMHSWLCLDADDEEMQNFLYLVVEHYKTLWFTEVFCSAPMLIYEAPACLNGDRIKVL